MTLFEREKDCLFDDRNEYVEEPDEEQDLSTTVDIEEEGEEEWE